MKIKDTIKKPVGGLRKLILGLTLAGTLLGTPLLAQELPIKFNIPKRFENYKKGFQIYHNNYYYAETSWNVITYDIDGDKIPEVQEMYLTGEKHPTMYCFDIDRSMYFEPEEILWDDAMDGLNGNEIWLGVKNKKEGIGKIA